MNTKTIKFLTVLAVLAMAFSSVAIFGSADESDAADVTVYVDKDGNDSTGDGTEAKPFKTIAKALDTTDVKTIILLDDAGDTAPFIVGKDVTIKAKEGLSVKPEIKITGSTVSNVGSHGGVCVGVAAAQTSTQSAKITVKFEGVKITNTEGIGTGYAVSVFSQTDLTIKNCEISGWASLVLFGPSSGNTYRGSYGAQDSNVTIIDSKLTGAGYAATDLEEGFATIQNQASKATITISGSEINATSSGTNSPMACIGMNNGNLATTAKMEATVTIDSNTTLNGSTYFVKNYTKDDDISDYNLKLKIGSKEINMITDATVKFQRTSDTYAYATDLIYVFQHWNSTAGLANALNAEIKGAVALDKDQATAYTLAAASAAHTLTIKSGGSLTIPEGVTWTLGTNTAVAVESGGTIVNNGIVKLNTTGTNDPSVTNAGTITNSGSIGFIAAHVPTFTLTNPISVKNGGVLASYTDGFADTVEAFVAGANSEFTYSTSGVTAVSGTTYADANIYSGWTLEIKNGAIVNVPTSCALDIKSGATLKSTDTTTACTAKIVIEEGAFYTVASDATTTAWKGKVEYNGSEPEIAIATSNADAKDKIENTTKGAAIITIPASADSADVAVGTKDVSINITGDVSNLNFTVAAGGSLAINTSNNTYSGQVTLGTQKVTLAGVRGDFTLVPGSIEIDGEITAGTLTLVNGDELIVKNELIVTGTATINVASGSATIVLSADADVQINGTLTIGAGITTKVYAEVTGTGTPTISNAGDIVVYSGGDVSLITVNGAGTISGADGNGGTWTISGAVLTLNNYHGAAYFGNLDLTRVVLIGENVITLTDVDASEAAHQRIFYSTGGLLISNDTGVASLVVSADITKGTTFYGVLTDTPDAVEIKGVSVSFSISGTPTTAAGIKCSTLTVYESVLSLDVCPTTFFLNTYEIYGVQANDAVKIQSSMAEITAGMYGIKTTTSTIDIDATSISVTASQYAIYGTTVTVSLGSEVEAIATGLTSCDKPSMAITATTALINKSDSEIAANSYDVAGGSNYAVLNVNGTMTITGIFTNQDGGEINVDADATIGVYGTFAIAGGEVTNLGNIVTYKSGTVQTVATSNPQAGATGVYAAITAIAATGKYLADGTIYVDATVNLAGAYSKTDVHYYGIAIVDSTGKITSMTLRNTSGTNYTSIITVSTVAGTTTTTNYQYTFVTSGYYYDEVAHPTSGSIKYGTAADGIALTLATGIAANAGIKISGGEVDNAGKIIINSQETAANFMTGGELNSLGEISVKDEIQIVKGELTTTGKFTLADNMTIGADGEFTGPVAVNNKAVKITVIGVMDSEIVFTGKYKTSATDDTKIDFTAAIAVDGKGTGTGFVIDTMMETYKPGFFKISNMDKANAKTETAITVQVGKAVLESSSVAAKATIAALKETTLEISGNVDVLGVIAIQDGATFNRWVEGDPSTYGYGIVTYVISFANEGYTYYGNLAFALANAPEGATLTLSKSTTITEDTSIKAGLTLIIGSGVTLTIDGDADEEDNILITMGEGASFVITDGVANALSIKYATVSGTFVYLAGLTELVLDEVVFDSATASTIKAVSATTLVDAGMTLAFQEIDDGTVYMKAGTFYGTMGLDAEFVTGSTTVVKNAGTLVIAEDAVSNVKITAGTDAPAKASILLEGTYNISENNTVLAIPIIGVGDIVLADGVTVTSKDGIAISATIGNGEDGFMFVAAKGNAFSVTSVAKTATVDAFVRLGGTLAEGSAAALGDVTVKDLSVSTTKAVLIVPEGSSITVEKATGVGPTAAGGYSLYAKGLVEVAGTILFDDDGTDYGKFYYEITYEDSNYTVYTVLTTALAKAPAGTVIEVDKPLTLDANTKIKSTITVVIAEDAYIMVPNGMYLVIGEGFTEVNAGGVVTGNIVLGGAIAYVIDFSTSGSDITVYTDAEMKSTQLAKSNTLLVLDLEYATVYATSNDFTFNTINQDLIKPEIDGYYFVDWELQNGKDVTNDTKLSDGPFVASMSASMVTVVFKSVAGIDYYVNNVRVNNLDAPVVYPYGSIVTAKISDPYSYEGTPLVNLASYLKLTDETGTVTGSGVTPIPEPPTPTPEEKSEWTITTILLCVLVVLIAIMAVIVALRLNRN